MKKQTVFKAAIIAASMFATVTGLSDTHRWLADKNGNFSNATNWTIKEGATGVAPSSGDDIEFWFDAATAKNWLYVTNDFNSSFSFGKIYFSACSVNVASNITTSSGNNVYVATSGSSKFANVVKSSGNWTIGQDFFVGGDNITGVTGVFTNMAGNITAANGFTYIAQGTSATGELVNVKGNLQTMKMLVANQYNYSRGDYIHNGGMLYLTARDLKATTSCMELGQKGYGRFIMNGGTFKYKHCITIGGATGAQGEMIINGGTVTNLNDKGWVHVGWEGRGTLQIGGAGKTAKFDTASEDILFGGWLSQDSTTNKLTLGTGGTLHVRHIRYHNGNSGAGKGLASFVLDGGTLQLYSDASKADIFYGDTSPWNSISSLKTKLFPSVTEKGGVIDTPQGFTALLPLAFTGQGTVTKAGNGTLTVSIAQANSGGFAVNGGTLKFTATGNILSGAPLLMTSGTFSCANATLVNRIEVLSGSKIASTGTLTFNSKTSLKLGFHGNPASPSAWASDLNKITATGVSVGSGIVVPITFETPVAFGFNDTYTLIKGAGLANSFSIASATANGVDITGGVYLAVESGNLVMKRHQFFYINIADAGSLEIPKTWVDANIGGDYSEGETAEFKTALSGTGANGIPRWQSYCLGLAPANPQSVVLCDLAKEQPAEAGKFRFTTNVAIPEGLSGVAVTACLDRKSGTGDWVQQGESQTVGTLGSGSPVFTADADLDNALSFFA